MSWFHSIIVDVEDIEAELRKLTHSSVQAANPNTAVTPEDVAAGKLAVAAIAKSITPPPGTAFSVSISGHNTTTGTVSIGDNVCANVAVIAKPVPVADTAPAPENN